MTVRSRELSSIGGETDQNLPDDNTFGNEQSDNEEGEVEEESSDGSDTENDDEGKGHSFKFLHLSNFIRGKEK